MYGFFQMVERLLIEALPWLTQLSASPETILVAPRLGVQGSGLPGKNWRTCFQRV
jgi:hypothetical protein